MPKGPRGEKRPADTNACAVMVAKIATGEQEEELPPMSGRQKSGREGGKARAANLSADTRREIAGKAATARWELERRRENMNVNVKQRLADLYKKKRESGLIDVKYFLQNVQGVPDEVVYAEALRFDEAVERGDTVALVFNDSRVAK